MRYEPDTTTLRRWLDAVVDDLLPVLENLPADAHEDRMRITVAVRVLRHTTDVLAND